MYFNFCEAFKCLWTLYEIHFPNLKKRDFKYSCFISLYPLRGVLFMVKGPLYIMLFFVSNSDFKSNQSASSRQRQPNTNCCSIYNLIVCWYPRLCSIIVERGGLGVDLMHKLKRSQFPGKRGDPIEHCLHLFSSPLV